MTTTKRSLPQLDSPARRRVLVLGAAGALAACSSTGSGDDAGPDDDVSQPGDDASQPGDDASQPGDDVPVGTCTPAGTSVGNVSTFAPGTWRVVSAARVIVGHDDAGLFAYSNICTHQGCSLTSVSTTGSSTCRCHGARFDGNGAVTLGPARRALDHYAVSVCEGTVYVNTSQTVAAAERTPV